MIRQALTSKHGPGGAHIGFSMFGSHGPLREGENDGAASGGSPTLPPPGTAPTITPGTAPVVEGKSFNQEQVNQIVQQRLAEDRARRPVTPAPAPTVTPKPAQSGSMTQEEVQTLLARDRAFTRVTATAQLSDRQVERMEAALRAENPTDVAAWSRSYLDDMGLTKQPGTPTTNPVQPGTPTVQTPPAAAPNAPSKVDPITSNGLVDIYRVTPEQFAQLTPAQIREHHERNVAAGNAGLGAPPLPKALQRK